jgi:hypothetical protein
MATDMDTGQSLTTILKTRADNSRQPRSEGAFLCFSPAKKRRPIHGPIAGRCRGFSMKALALIGAHPRFLKAGPVSAASSDIDPSL